MDVVSFYNYTEYDKDEKYKEPEGIKLLKSNNVIQYYAIISVNSAETSQ
jgi:hypothetical protein